MRSMLRLSISACLLVLLAAAVLPGSAAALVSTGGGWSWLSPQPEGNQLLSATFVNPLVGWACGQGGTLLKTTDGGVTWHGVNPHIDTNLIQVTFVDELHGWLRGEAGGAKPTVIVRTVDGGVHWNVVYRGATRIGDISFGSRMVGVATGYPPALLRTTDGGSTWTKPAAPVAGPLGRVCMVSATIGYMTADPDGGSGDAVLKTTNGGRTWVLVATFAGTTLWSIDASDANAVYASGSHWDATTSTRLAVVERSIDGGGTWSDVPPPNPGALPGDNPVARGVVVADADHAWVSWDDNGPGQVSYTNDGGGAWSTTTEDFAVAGCIDSLNAWAMSGAGVSVTTNAGATWQSAWGASTTGQSGAIDFVSDVEGWSVGQGVIHTSDGGLTWKQQTMPLATQGWTDVDFVDQLNGWAIGTFGEVAHTVDGGVTWELQTTYSSYLGTVEAVDAQTAWIIGRIGVIETTDGGKTWAGHGPTGIPGGFEPYDVHFFNASEGIICGNRLTVAITSDGGANWVWGKLGDTYDSRSFTAMTWTDRLHGWMVGTDGLLCRTTNGGWTWKQLSTGAVGADFVSVSFSDALHGWIGGSLSLYYTVPVMLHTTNGGTSWRLQYMGPPFGAVGDLAARSSALVFATCGGGVFSTTTGGVPSSGDRMPPTLAIRKPKGLWHNHRVTVSIGATDASGVRLVLVRLDSAPRSKQNGVTIAPASDGSTEGMHTVRGTALDMLGNGTGTVTAKVGIDSSRPSTYTKSGVCVHPGGAAHLTYTVKDYKPGCGAANMILRIATTKGKTLKSVPIGVQSTNTWHTYSYHNTMPIGHYVWYIYARDIAGNAPHYLYYSDFWVSATIVFFPLPPRVPPYFVGGGEPSGYDSSLAGGTGLPRLLASPSANEAAFSN